MIRFVVKQSLKTVIGLLVWDMISGGSLLGLNTPPFYHPALIDPGGKGIIIKIVEEKIAHKLAGLSAEYMMVYEEIRNSGNNGIWNREIKTNTNIQQQTLAKALKELERRMLIKSVKSIHQKTKKVILAILFVGLLELFQRNRTNQPLACPALLCPFLQTAHGADLDAF